MKILDELMTDKEFRKFIDHFLKEVLPQIRQSNYIMTLVPTKDEMVDIAQALEIGYCILYDKPLIVVAPEGRHTGERLRRIADHVIVADITTEDGRAEVETKLKAVLKQ